MPKFEFNISAELEEDLTCYNCPFKPDYGSYEYKCKAWPEIKMDTVSKMFRPHTCRATKIIGNTITVVSGSIADD